MQEAEDILDMVFESTIHKEAELVRCFKTEKQIHVYLLLVGLSTSETEHLLELINKKMAKFEPKTSGKQIPKKGDFQDDGIDEPEMDEEDLE